MNGRIWTKKIIPRNGPNWTVPSDGMCLLKCIQKIDPNVGVDLYNEFCLGNKIFEDIFPMCKVGKFLDFLNMRGKTISLGKYCEKKKIVVPIRNYTNTPIIHALHIETLKEYGISHYILISKVG